MPEGLSNHHKPRGVRVLPDPKVEVAVESTTPSGLCHILKEHSIYRPSFLSTSVSVSSLLQVVRGHELIHLEPWLPDLEKTGEIKQFQAIHSLFEIVGISYLSAV